MNKEIEYLRCQKCGYSEPIPNEEELRLETMRCPNCGDVGTLEEDYN